MMKLEWETLPHYRNPNGKAIRDPSPAQGGCDYAKMGFNPSDTAVNSITLTQSSSHSHPPLMSASEWRGEGRDAGRVEVKASAP